MPSRGSMRPSDIGASLCGHLRACAPSELRTERTKAVSAALRRLCSINLWLEATGPSSLRYLRPFDCMACPSVNPKRICTSHKSHPASENCKA